MAETILIKEKSISYSKNVEIKCKDKDSIITVLIHL